MKTIKIYNLNDEVEEWIKKEYVLKLIDEIGIHCIDQEWLKELKLRING